MHYNNVTYGRIEFLNYQLQHKWLAIFFLKTFNHCRSWNLEVQNLKHVKGSKSKDT